LNLTQKRCGATPLNINPKGELVAAIFMSLTHQENK
jgi:hypothetical protein